jgi:cytochrome b561
MLRWLPLPITVTGVGVIWAAGRDVLAFGIPVMSGAAERSTDLQGTMEMAHSGLWYFLTALLVMHIIVALEQ